MAGKEHNITCKVSEITDDCCCRKKVRDNKEYKDLINRLNRIEGQICGIRRMVEKDAYCIDILNQVSAARSAMNGFSKKLMENHIKSCVTKDIKNGKEETVDELVETIKKFM
ncbi:MAG: metal-sensing transcriptional repressor [Lachnospira sp.]